MIHKANFICLRNYFYPIVGEITVSIFTKDFMYVSFIFHQTISYGSDLFFFRANSLIFR
jgi:hypothetical protein